MSHARALRRSYDARPILGITIEALHAYLEARGFVASLERDASTGGDALRFVEYARAGVLFLETMAIAVDLEGGVRLISSSLHAGRSLTRDEAARADATAGTVLGALASVPYAGSDAARAQEWIRAHIIEPGATVAIGSARFEIDPDTTHPGRSYRVTIVAAA